ncbi:MAG: preprotein translocase subunit SecG [Clostridiales bacterium]|nr:preprotein translocase subunit SecG [Clostridiales bacterium]
MLNLLSFFVEISSVVFGIRIALATIALICIGFVIFVVMKQSGNTDGVEAITGSSNKSDESETYYGKNAGSRKEARLKLWTYIAAGVLALCFIVLLILQTFIK